MSCCEYMFAKKDDFFVLKMVGSIRYLSSARMEAFNDYVSSQDKCPDVLIDLSQVEIIDSTVLGLMARLANYVSVSSGKKVALLCPTDDVYQILLSMGFDQVFLILKDACELDPEGLESIPDVKEDDLSLAKRMLSAHKHLTAISEKNEEIFRSFIAHLEKNIKSKES